MIFPNLSKYLSNRKSAAIPITFILSYLSLHKFTSQIHLSLRIGPRGEIGTREACFFLLQIMNEYTLANGVWLWHVSIGYPCVIKKALLFSTLRNFAS